MKITPKELVAMINRQCKKEAPALVYIGSRSLVPVFEKDKVCIDTFDDRRVAIYAHNGSVRICVDPEDIVMVA